MSALRMNMAPLRILVDRIETPSSKPQQTTGAPSGITSPQPPPSFTLPAQKHMRQKGPFSCESAAVCIMQGRPGVHGKKTGYFWQDAVLSGFTVSMDGSAQENGKADLSPHPVPAKGALAIRRPARSLAPVRRRPGGPTTESTALPCAKGERRRPPGIGPGGCCEILILEGEAFSRAAHRKPCLVRVAEDRRGGREVGVWMSSSARMDPSPWWGKYIA
ncbi:hypothetical protein B0I37DRAFT_65279 [Chaetomium sp. MPI-CAGE-AT-0009]|nr:hypothetical protein B0I37DRAFT_65279 [Chaetomium sp. MPI-CAGE-AT-0009]